jgi:hypothetical protein
LSTNRPNVALRVTLSRYFKNAKALNPFPVHTHHDWLRFSRDRTDLANVFYSAVV